ncbi:MAG: hypothetical protein IIT46_13680 [Lachnospiraceae bacterium]|nr:hypothetical protein [Lachnospiraceae bacterium]
MKKITSSLKSISLYLFLIMYALILIVDIGFQWMDYCCKKNVVLPNIFIFLLVGFAFWGLIALIGKKKDSIEKKLEKSDKIIAILTVGLFFVQVLITYCIIFRTSWDAGIVTAQARLVAQHSDEVWSDYYSKHPNNLFITFLYSFFYGIAGKFGDDSYGVILIAIFQCLLSTLAVYLVYRVMRKICDGRLLPVGSWIVAVLWVGMSPWKIIPYSDSFGIIFPIFIVWIYQSLQKNKLTVIKCISIGMITALGYKIKPSIVIVFIAIMILEVFKLISNEHKKETIGKMSILALSLVLTVGGVGCFDMVGYMNIDYDKEAACGMTHFLMVGFREDTNGIYNPEDEEFSVSFATRKERSKANLLEVKRRIQEFGVLGLIKHSTKKSLSNFNDGTFTWGWDGDFYAGIISEPDPVLSPVLRSFYYDDGKLNFLFVLIMQFWWLFVIVGMLLNVVDVIKQHEISDEKFLLLLSIIGLTIFVMLFEGRARYLYLYSPIYVIVGALGIKSFYEKIVIKDKAEEGKIK